VSLVFQDNEVFSSTVLANVSYGSAHATEKEIIQALKLAHAYDFVMKLPHGVNSEIGERGVKLSGGQKQRIQIARAILKNAPILILDEATSSLDAQSEREVQHALEVLMKDKLVIIIAHRFSTIQNADTILVVENGKIIDQGSPSQLAQRDGIYKDLLRYQIEGNKKLLAGYDIF
jgi:ABC-type multidrug transport system fused ATPase/permease subunit